MTVSCRRRRSPAKTLVRRGFFGAVRYACLNGGKRLRPFLLVETARLFGIESEGVLRAGAAVEMIHCYSLVHDDLPSAR